MIAYRGGQSDESLGLPIQRTKHAVLHYYRSNIANTRGNEVGTLVDGSNWIAG